MLLREARQHRRQQEGGVVLGDAQAHQPGLFGSAQARQGLVGQAQEPARVEEKLLAGRVGPERPAVAVEQRPADLLLEPLHLHAHRRLAAPDAGGRVQDAPAFHDGDEAAEQGEVERFRHDLSARLR
ncbi:hypothetical protein Rumeso_03362 [Rubellimicrobium mesophilum DSM 19309]|uniref:Uncharacterized protein n=1 Tax=Rubellimicrobium mesophilum DSM 19309 TaxID=442562 RepID=A0A017HMR0_9RHOB|nr:hypothetical protein [Rubellimicrobium mesophilum]EYD75034.1 hypothetical protein Rumeso_03362 [Rubellimicrobium mesophilum DSM 19309]